MSVVVCKVNEKNIEIAADSICVSGWSKLPHGVGKNIKLASVNGTVIGGCGLAEEISLFFCYAQTHSIATPVTANNVLNFILEFRDWKSNYTRTSTFENTYIIACDGKAYYVEGMLVMPIDNYCAIGAGRDFANGALYMGATAEQAVQAACELCAMVAEPIVVERISK